MTGQPRCAQFIAKTRNRTADESADLGALLLRLGEVGKAFIVTRPGHELTEADVLAHCRERLANFKVPRQVQFISVLPRNPSGKILRRQLREPYWAGKDRRVN